VVLNKIKCFNKALSLSPGDRCPECTRKRRKKIGDLEINMSVKLLECSHCGNRFREDGTMVKQ